VTPPVKTFNGYGMGSYVVFIDTTAALYDAEAFQAPDTLACSSEPAGCHELSVMGLSRPLGG
jgi:hypothetical protein